MKFATLRFNYIYVNPFLIKKKQKNLSIYLTHYAVSLTILTLVRVTVLYCTSDYIVSSQRYSTVQIGFDKEYM